MPKPPAPTCCRWGQGVKCTLCRKREIIIKSINWKWSIPKDGISFSICSGMHGAPHPVPFGSTRLTSPPSNPAFMHPLTPNPLKFIFKVLLHPFSRLLMDNRAFQGCQRAEGGSLHTGSSRVVRMPDICQIGLF